VQHALQDHPESPRLWATMIDNIFKSIGLKATTHEPCMYTSTVNGTKIFFLHQLDDFMVSVPNEENENHAFNLIQAKLKLSLKLLGHLKL